MRQENRPVFVTDDGEVFSSEQAALEHETKEREKAKALARLKIYSVNHGFDATEGRGYFAQTLIISDASKSVLIQWCLDTFGPVLSGWYGGGFFEAWHMNEPREGATVEWAMKQEGVSNFRHNSPTKIAVVSKNDFTSCGLPASQFPWPRPVKS